MPHRSAEIGAGRLLYRSGFDAASLGHVRRQVQRHLNLPELPRDRADDLLIAAGEILANAIEHGGGAGTIELRRGEDRVLCDISDDGPGLPAGAHGTHIAAPLDERGRGLRLAHQLCDEVLHHAVAKGTHITLAMVVR